MMESAEWSRLLAYAAGACTEAERVEVEAWMAADPQRRVLCEEIRRVWEVTGKPPIHFDSAYLWKQLEARMDEVDAQEHRLVRTLGSRPPMPLRRRQNRQRFTQILHLSAILLAVTVMTVLVTRRVRTPVSTGVEAVKREIMTERGQRTRMRLPDGTYVTLNADSKLSLPSPFIGASRDVYLEGEAYFEVAPDAERPFIVHAAETTTRVLGTEFGVSAYPGAGAVDVIVAGGKVAFRSTRPEAPQEAVLTPRMIARIIGNAPAEVRENVDPARWLAWTEGQLVFVDTPFPEVTARLERWYDIEIHVDASLVDVDRLNAIYSVEPLSEVLEILCASLDLRYESTGTSVTFYPLDEAP